MSRPRSSAISAICANEIGNLRYHRTHQRMTSPGSWRHLKGFDAMTGTPHPLRIRSCSVFFATIPLNTVFEIGGPGEDAFDAGRVWGDDAHSGEGDSELGEAIFHELEPLVRDEA